MPEGAGRREERRRLSILFVRLLLPSVFPDEPEDDPPLFLLLSSPFHATKKPLGTALFAPPELPDRPPVEGRPSDDEFCIELEIPAFDRLDEVNAP